MTKNSGWKFLTFVTKSSILDFAVVPGTPLKGALRIVRASSLKTYFNSYRTKKLFTLINVFFSRTRNFSLFLELTV